MTKPLPGNIPKEGLFSNIASKKLLDIFFVGGDLQDYAAVLRAAGSGSVAGNRVGGTIAHIGNALGL